MGSEKNNDGSSNEPQTAGSAESQVAIEAFLDRNGYTGREVRSIARHAIAAWVAQSAG